MPILYVLESSVYMKVNYMRATQRNFSYCMYAKEYTIAAWRIYQIMNSVTTR
jgi:hypothetical protein